MKCSHLVVVLVLLMQSLFSHANPIENPQSCSLPAPAWLTATNITSSNITIEWADVNGAVGYRVTRYDVTHGINLPDADVTEPEYISGPHDPGTTIAFEVFPKCANEELGSPIGGEYTTNYIVIDDIVNFTAPIPPNGNVDILPSQSQAFGFTNAAIYQPTVNVLRLKVSYTDSHNDDHFAEVLMWSHCSNPMTGGPRVMYWNDSIWGNDVSYTENHLNENPNGPIVSITFRYDNNSQPFFTINNPTMSYPENGNEPILGTLTIYNDRSAAGPLFNNTIHVARSYNVERNPCYIPRMQGGGGQTPKYLEASISAGSEERNQANVADSLHTALKVSPNPFSNGFKVDYSLTTETSVSFNLLDLTGREINTININALPVGEYSTFISTDNLPTGIYLLSMQTAQGRTMTTLVKH